MLTVFILHHFTLNMCVWCIEGSAFKYLQHLVVRIVFDNNGYQEGNCSHVTIIEKLSFMAVLSWCYLQTPRIA
jgi:hypothetical protein